MDKRDLEKGVVANQKDDGIFTDLFGGLNTVASDLNCPVTDSPLLLNCDIDVSGKVVKRKGTKLLLESALAGTLGYTLIPMTTGLLYTFLVEKFGTTLTVYEINNDTITSLVSKTNVWNSTGGAVRANYVKTAEYEPRIILTTGVNQPVQLKFVEQQQIAAGVAANYAFTNATRYANASLSNLIVYKNRTRVTPGSVSYAAGTLTLNGVSSVANDVIDIIMVTWQHHVDALVYQGNRFTKQITRFNVVASDAAVAIPSTMIDDPKTQYDAQSPVRWNVIAYESTAYGDVYNFSTSREPSAATEYAMGDGGMYVYAAGNKVNPSPFFFQFGAITGSTPITVVASRRRTLEKLNGGQGVVGTSLKVYVDSVLKTQNTNNAAGSATYSDYYLYSDAGAILTSTASTGYTLSFEASTTIGVPETATVEIINCSTSFIGSGANANVDAYADGTCFPCYGIGEFANYFTGSFPSNVSFYEGRLVFSGFSNDPLLVVFSEIGDKSKIGFNFASFQIDALATDSDDPVDILLNSRPDDYITGMIQWQKSLFVFSRQAVFKISGGENGFSNTSKFSTRISDIGLVNGFSLVRTDRSILYLSDIGVFDLFLGVDSEDYVASEKSLKIRNKFGVTRLPSRENLSWMAYDNSTQKVYLGLPIEALDYTSFRLYVYNTFREAWTEYETPGGWNLYTCAPFTDRTLGQGFMGAAVSKRDSSNIPSNRCFITWEFSKYVDFRSTATGDGADTTFTLPFDRRYFTTTTTDQVYEYGTSVENTSSRFAFQTLPFANVQDIAVELETGVGSGAYTTLTFDTDFSKRPNGNIYLYQNPGTGKTLRIRQRLPVTDSEPGEDLYETTVPLPFHDSVVVWIDNVLRAHSAHYTTTIAGTYEITFVTAPVNLSVIEFGRVYQAVYSSPLLTLSSFGAVKRPKFCYAYFDNSIGQPTWKLSDINTARTPDQPVAEIVGKAKQRLNATIILSFESDYDGSVEYDLYGFQSLVWDDSLFDIGTANQYRNFALFKESLPGVGYGYRLSVFSFDESAFALAGYQVTTRPYAERTIHWTG